jgi:predicted amidohydrolase
VHLHPIDEIFLPQIHVIIGLASPAVATSLEDGLRRIDRLLADASARGAELVCFPEAYLPGLRGLDFEVPDWSPHDEERAIAEVSRLAKAHGVATIMGMERITDGGRQIAAYMFDRDGALLGFQPKCQLDPSEERNYVPGDTRRVFEVGGVKFGIAICHEGWRYPETVRWAAARGAKIVFHPQHTGAHTGTVRLSEWASPRAPYYEKAMVCRSIENAIWFASVNYALPFPESATAVIAPDGECAAYLPYGEEGVLVHEIDVDRATGHLAARYAPERYRDAVEGVVR